MNTLLRDKKRGGNVSIPLPPQRSSLITSLNYHAIRIIQLTQASVESFSLRGANDTSPRACQFT